MITKADLDTRFTHHPPTGGKGDKHRDIRVACRKLAGVIVEQTHASREQSKAISCLEEAMMWANACIARHVEVDT